MLTNAVIFEPLWNMYSQSTKYYFKSILGILLLILISNYAAQIQSTDKQPAKKRSIDLGSLILFQTESDVFCEALGDGGV